MDESLKKRHLEREKEVNNFIAESKSENYQSYAMTRMYDDHYRIVEAKCNGASLVELGCGTGEFIERHLKSNPEAKVMGLDVAEQCIEVARNRLVSLGCVDNVKFFVGDSAIFHQLVSEDGLSEPISNVVMRGVIHHLAEPADTFESCFKVLTEGGRLIILEGNVESIYRKFVLWFADFLGVEHEASELEHTSSNDIKSSLEQLGYVDISVHFVPGVFAPLAYSGFGGERLWRVLDGLNRALGCVAGRIFGWWYLITADKPKSTS